MVYPKSGEVFEPNFSVDSLTCLLSFYSTFSHVSSFFQQLWSQLSVFRGLHLLFCSHWTAEKGASGNDPHLLLWQNHRRRKTITIANRCGISFLLCFTHKTLLRRLRQLTYEHLMLGARIIPPHTHSVDGQVYKACVASTYSMEFTHIKNEAKEHKLFGLGK